jgi:hypothetical protein
MARGMMTPGYPQTIDISDNTYQLQNFMAYQKTAGNSREGSPTNVTGDYGPT